MSNTGDTAAIEDVTLAAGTKLGKYEIVRMLGAGGMGAVYEAVHAAIGKHVAVKTLNPSLAAMPGARARFLREAELTTKVQHPHIVDVTDMGTEGDHTFIVMEFLRGEDLSQRLARINQFAMSDLVDVMLPVASAVTTAHDAGIVHRDLKPQNIFLANVHGGLHPKVLDFGISKQTDSAAAAALTSTGAMVGTPYYLAPEQIENAQAASAASDQYALGVILYECLAGRRPFQGDSIFLIFQSIVSANPPSLAHLRPDLPVELVAVIARAMAKAPAARFPSVRALGAALLPFASQKARLVWESTFGAVVETDTSVAAFMPQATSLLPSGESGTGTRALPATTTPLPAGRASFTNMVAPLQQSAPTDEFGVARSKKPWALVAGAGGALLVVVIAVLIMGGGDKADPKTKTPPTASPGETSARATAAPVEARPAAPRFRVRVAAEPASAQLALDRETPVTGELDRELAADGRSHSLTVTAPGHIEKVVEFTDTPPPAHVSLDKLPEPPAGATAVRPGKRPPRETRSEVAKPEGKAAATPQPPPLRDENGRLLNPNGAPLVE